MKDSIESVQNEFTHYTKRVNLMESIPNLKV